jgi:alcohol dehydrogenase (cytochrome c)
MIKTYCVALLLLAGAFAPMVHAQDEAPPPPPPAGAARPAQAPAAPPPGMFATGPLPHDTVKDYKPVTNDMLLNPRPDDWLMFSRTYDAWRYSPLKQINKKTVNQLHIAWVKGLPAGTTETIPLVHDGIIYLIAPGSDVMAVDGKTGDIIWEYKRTYKNPQIGPTERTKALAIF